MPHGIPQTRRGREASLREAKRRVAEGPKTCTKGFVGFRVQKEPKNRGKIERDHTWRTYFLCASESLNHGVKQRENKNRAAR